LSKIQRTFELLEGVDPEIALLLAISIFVPLFVLLATFRTPSLIFAMLVVGSCVLLRWEVLNVIGLLGKYPLLVVLAIVALVYRGKFRPSWLTRLYLVYCAVIVVGVFNPRSGSLEPGATLDGFIKFASYILAYFGLIVLTAKMCADQHTSKQLLPWLLIWAVIVICIQFPFWSYLEGPRLTGVYQIPGTLQHSLARSIVILALFLLSRGWGKWFVPGVAIILAAAGMLILTGGRTAIGSVLAAMPFVLRVRPGRAVLLVLVTALLGSAVLVRVLPTVWGFGQTAEHLWSLESERYKMWRTIWPEVMAAPFFGHGTNTSERYSTQRFGITLHNSYLDLAYDYGLPFAAAFMVVLGLAGLRAWRQMARAPTLELRQLAALSGALLVMLAVEALFLSDVVRINLKWFLVCMCIGIQEGVAWRLRAASGSPGLDSVEWDSQAQLSNARGGLHHA